MNEIVYRDIFSNYGLKVSIGHTFERDQEQRSKCPVGFEVPDGKLTDG